MGEYLYGSEKRVEKSEGGEREMVYNGTTGWRLAVRDGTGILAADHQIHEYIPTSAG